MSTNKLKYRIYLVNNLNDVPPPRLKKMAWQKGSSKGATPTVYHSVQRDPVLGPISSVQGPRIPLHRTPRPPTTTKLFNLNLTVQGIPAQTDYEA